MAQHGSARLSVHSRRTIALRVLEQGWSVTAAAQAANVSRQTATKWVGRYRDLGESGLADRSTRPRRIAFALGPRMVRRIESLRRRRIGSHRIAWTLQLARSSVYRVLRRLGLSRLSRLEPRPDPNRYEWPQPGDLVHLDTKKIGRMGSSAGWRFDGTQKGRTTGLGWTQDLATRRVGRAPLDTNSPVDPVRRELLDRRCCYHQSSNSCQMRVGGLFMSKPAGISPTGRAELSTVLGSRRRFVTPADVVEALGVDAPTAAKKLSRWAAEGWLRRARRGLYIPVPVDASNPATWSEDALIVGSAVWAPCYFTGWTSANHWALTDQVFRTTIVKTTKRVRTSSVRLLDHDYLVTHASPSAMDWGMKAEWRGEVKLRIADAARTVIDILDSPRLGGGIRHTAEILAAYLEDHDALTLVEYGDRLGNRTVFKRLGFIVEIVAPVRASLIEKCQARVSAGVSPLDPDGPKGGSRVPKWGLRVNVQLAPEEPA